MQVEKVFLKGRALFVIRGQIFVYSCSCVGRKIFLSELKEFWNYIKVRKLLTDRWKKISDIKMKPYNRNSFEMSDELLIDAYNKAIQLRLDKAFIKLLKEEIERRKKKNDKKEQ